MAGELSFFELGVEDADRARTFYAGPFGWQIESGPSRRAASRSARRTSPAAMHGGDRGATPLPVLRGRRHRGRGRPRAASSAASSRSIDISGATSWPRASATSGCAATTRTRRFGLHQRPRLIATHLVATTALSHAKCGPSGHRAVHRLTRT